MLPLSGLFSLEQAETTKVRGQEIKDHQRRLEGKGAKVVHVLPRVWDSVSTSIRPTFALEQTTHEVKRFQVSRRISNKTLFNT